MAEHARGHGQAAGHTCLSNLAQGTVCKILDAEEVKPHKVRHCRERRDPQFGEKMAEVLRVYRQVGLLKKRPPSDTVTSVSYGEKPGVTAIRTTAPDLPAVRGVHPTLARDHEYKCHGTVTLLAGIDLLSGKIHALVQIAIAAASLSSSSNCLMPRTRRTPQRSTVLGSISPKVSCQSSLASCLVHIRVASKQELRDRFIAAIDHFNRHPVVHTWTYKLGKAACCDLNSRKR